MRVVLLNQPFHPDVAATAQMGKDLADRLVREGHQVVAIASRSLYGQRGGSLPKREVVDGIEIHRVGVSLFGKSSIAARLADFLLFYVLAFLKLMTIPRPDVVVPFTTPPFIALAAIVGRWLRRWRVVCWLMDVYPDVAVSCGVMRPGGLLTRVLEGLNRWVLARCDAVVVLGRCMRERVLAKGIAAERVHLIPVWADTHDIRPIAHAGNPYRERWGLAPAADRWGGREPVCVMYSGNFGIAHEAATICQAMLRLREFPPRESPGDASRPVIPVRFVFVGGGKRRAEIERFIEGHGLGWSDDAAVCARYEEYQPRESIGQSLAAGDIHLVSILEGTEGTIVPSKLLGIMAAGRPAILIGPGASETGRVIAEVGMGEIVRQGDSERLAWVIGELAADGQRMARLGTRAREGLVDRFDAATATGQWAALLAAVVRGRRADVAAG